MISSIKDKKQTVINNYLTTLYYYMLPKNELNDETIESFGYIGDCIESICYNPFIEKNNLYSIMVNVDLSRYDYRGGIEYPYIYRITDLSFKDITLGMYDLATEYSNYSSNFESKLLLYPYRYFLLTDYINPPLLIQPQLLSDNKITINVKIGMSNTSKYLLYCKDYKGDVNGNLEGIVNNNPLLFPVTSNSYQSFIANSGISFDTNKQLALLENNQSYKQNRQNNILNSIGSLIGIGGGLTQTPMGTLGALGIASNITSLGSNILNGVHNKQNYKLKEYEIEKSALATISDKMNTPNVIKSIGNDSIFNIENSKNRVDLIEYSITNNRLMKITDFLCRYGVTTNRYTIPNFKTRKYFNYIKTINCNIDSEKIPYNDLQELEQIFNSGVTFWHIDNGAEIKNYYVNNEVLIYE